MQGCWKKVWNLNLCVCATTLLSSYYCLLLDFVYHLSWCIGFTEDVGSSQYTWGYFKKTLVY
jgi:hypothetical protein